MGEAVEEASFLGCESGASVAVALSGLEDLVDDVEEVAGGGHAGDASTSSARQVRVFGFGVGVASFEGP